MGERKFLLPDWVENRMEDEGFDKNKVTNQQDELLRNAYFGLLAGELGALATLLKSDAGGLHPLIAHKIVGMIEKNSAVCEFSLETKPQLPLSRRSQSGAAVLRKSLRTEKIALQVAAKGGHKRGMFEAAISATCDATNLKRASVTKAWGKYKENKKNWILQIAWGEKLSKEYGGFNIVIAKQDAGELPEKYPEGFMVDDLDHKIYASIERDLNLASSKTLLNN